MSRHRARKRFGQHWLVDPVVLDRIVGYDVSEETRVPLADD